jgi:hypothetical protein
MSKQPHPSLVVLETLTSTGARKSARLLTFLKEPDSETDNWDYKLTPAFNEALDIKMTDRVNDGGKGKVWTQGANFNFKAGDVVHSINGAIALQVTASSSATQSEELSLEGNVQYDIFEIENGKYIKKGNARCSQVAFVRKLIGG